MDQTEADAPAENDWLSASEAVLVNGMRFARRTGRQALAEF